MFAVQLVILNSCAISAVGVITAIDSMRLGLFRFEQLTDYSGGCLMVVCLYCWRASRRLFVVLCSIIFSRSCIKYPRDMSSPYIGVSFMIHLFLDTSSGLHICSARFIPYASEPLQVTLAGIPGSDLTYVQATLCHSGVLKVIVHAFLEH